MRLSVRLGMSYGYLSQINRAALFANSLLYLRRRLEESPEKRTDASNGIRPFAIVMDE